MNPHADLTYNYADTGLRKDPPTTMSPSQRLDSQSMGPGEAYDLEIEGGAGGVQQSVGDFLYHCHIAKHYVSGMWSFWRVLNTRIPDLQPLPDQPAPPDPVDSQGLIGKTMPDGTVLTSANIDSWIAPQLPPQGVPQSAQDPAVWNYTVQNGTYLGEPEDLTTAPDSIMRYSDPAHPNRLPGDQMAGSRPKIMFDPTTGRPAYPLLRTHIGHRPPFTPNGHSGATYLGENAGTPKTSAVSPWAGRADGLCPTGRPLRTFNVVAIETTVPLSKTTVDPDGSIHGWGHGLVGQLIVEPAGSTYHDPKTGAIVDSGTIVDIHTTNPLAPGVVNGSFRELALWTINDNDQNARSTLNLRSEPTATRDPATKFSSYVNGDPITPLPTAYPGDKIVIRSINVSPTLDTLHVQGGRFLTENRYVDANGPQASLIDTIHHGMSERTTLILNGNGSMKGDYVYFSGSATRINQGAWGLIRILPGHSANLQPLPGGTDPSTSWSPPTGTSPPPTTDPGNPCPSGAPIHPFAISALDLPDTKGAKVAYVRTTDIAAVRAGTKKVEPLVMHVAAGECVQVDFTNARTPEPVTPTNPKASFSVAKLARDPESSGVDAGYSSEQNVSPGQSRRYVYYVDSAKLGSATIADFGADSAKSGLHGAVVVAPSGATFTDPSSGTAVDVGSQVDVHVAGGAPYRDFTLDFADDDFDLGRDFMGYVTDAHNGTSTVNYAVGRAGDNYSSWGQTDPATPILKSYAGDAVQVHALMAPGSEQGHVLSLGGMSWPIDPNITDSNEVAAQGFGPWESVDAVIAGGAGGWAHATGDFFYGDLRRPFTVAGMWGYQRVLAPSSCAIRNLDGTPCTLAPPAPPVITGITPATGPPGTAVSITGSGLTGTQFVAFTGAAGVTATVVSDGDIRVVVPADAATGPVRVTTRTASATSSATFTVTVPTGPSPPTVTGIAPPSGPPGTVVSVSGTGFSGATSLTFGGVAASFTVGSDKSITAAVPSGAVSGAVKIATPTGSASSPGAFTVVPPAVPSVSGLTPKTGKVGIAVVISGANLATTTSVTFNGIPATFTVAANGTLNTAVPAGATTGLVRVTTPGGSVSGGTFAVIPPAPTITSFTPGSGKVGSRVTIIGTNLAGTQIVTLTGVVASFVVVSDTTVTATIPNAKAGPFVISTLGGSVTSSKTFTVK